VHLVTAGTDRTNLLLRSAPLAVLSAATAFLTYRLLVPRRRGARAASA
jgi:hypothetical protein